MIALHRCLVYINLEIRINRTHERKKMIQQIMALTFLLMAKATLSLGMPNVLLIVSEDNGPELGCYGDPYARTPVLDRLAESGVRFARAFVPYSVCSPSRACFLTGLYPHQNGQLGLATHKFSTYGNIPNLFTLMKSAGYRTGLIGKLHVNPEKDFPVDYRDISGANFGRRNMKEYAESADTFFNGSDEPFFLSINYPDAHFPLHKQQFGLPETPIESNEVKPLPWVGVDSARLRQFTADYYNCLQRLDDGIGMLIQKLKESGKFNETLIIYIGDHGAQFSRGKCSVYEAGMRVPFMISWQGVIRSGEVRNELVSTLDLLPTLLGLIGSESLLPENLPGRSLEPLLNGLTVPWRQYVFGFTTGAAPRIFHLAYSVRGERYKLIVNPLSDGTTKNLSAEAYHTHLNSHYIAGTTMDEIKKAPAHVQSAYRTFLNSPRFELYDLEKDPYEFNNLAHQAEYTHIRESLLDALQNWQRKTRDPLSQPKMLSEFAERQLEMRDLSYRKDEGFRWPYLDQFPSWIHR
jgi:N-sulfoglucosamine sulfohydrolase